MKAEHLYQALVELAEKLGVHVSEQNFRSTGIKARSGYAVVKGKPTFLIDKHRNLQQRIQILSEFLGELSFDDVFLVPAVRDHLINFRPIQKPAGDEARKTPREHSANDSSK